MNKTREVNKKNSMCVNFVGLSIYPFHKSITELSKKVNIVSLASIFELFV